ncbi:hypothetical protein KJ855_03825 [Patescibacteria group bacterium]|nr:hypothetical protein [Patescibacteria group bacterium]
MKKDKKMTIEQLAQMMMRQFGVMDEKFGKRFDGLEGRVMGLEDDMKIVKADLVQVMKGHKALLYYMEMLGASMSDLAKEAKKNVSYESFKALENRVVKLEMAEGKG